MNPGSFYIDSWLVEPSLNAITGPDGKQSIEPKMMLLLVRLAEARGKVVSRDDLFETVWGNEIIVGDGSLTTSISELRKVFRDDPRNPSFIETIRGRGYRIVAPISVNTLDGKYIVSSMNGYGSSRRVEEPFTQTIPPATSIVFRRRHLSYLIGVAITLVAVVLGVRNLRVGETNNSFSITKLTSMRGVEYGPVFAPDGEQIAFVFFDELPGHANIYLQRVGESESFRLTNLDGAEFYPAWSPDGQEIAFVWNRSDGCGIFTIPSAGGEVKELWQSNYSIRHLDWSPDGQSIAFSYAADESGTQQIFVLSLDSMQLRQITAPSESWSDYWPAFSPDGNQIAFRRMTGDKSEDIFVYSIGDEPGSETRLSHDDVSLMGVDWSTDGRNLIFASTRERTNGIWQISSSGGSIKSLRRMNVNELLHFALSPTVAQNNRAAFVQETTEINIRQLGLDPQSQSQSGEVVLGSTQRDEFPDFSPTGEKIAFISTRSGFSEIWVSDAAGDDARQITWLKNPSLSLPKWSHDGKRIAFEISVDGQADIYMINIETGAVSSLLDSDDNEVAPQWAANDDGIIFGTDAGGGWHLRKYHLAMNSIETIVDGGYQGFESPDEKFVYYTTHESPDIWEYSVDNQLSVRKTFDLSNQSVHNVVAAKSGLYFVTWDALQGVFNVNRLDWSSHNSEIVGSLPKKSVYYFYEWGIAISPDESILLYGSIDNEESDIFVVDNF